MMAGSGTDASVAERSLDALTKLLMGNSVKTIRAVIPIFSTIYPVIFKLLYDPPWS